MLLLVYDLQRGKWCIRQQTEALCLSVYLSILEVYQVLFGKSNEGKRPVVKGLWMSFRAQEILPVYKIDWHLLFPTMFRLCNLVMKVFNL